MDKAPSRSFAIRLAVAYASAAVGLMLIILGASTFFTMQLYARTTNEVIQSATSTVELRIREYSAQHIPVARYAARLTADLRRPRVRVAVFDSEHRLLSESMPLQQMDGIPGAVASLLDLRTMEVPLSNGFVLVSANLDQVKETLHAYYTLMLPVGILAIALASVAGWVIARRAVAPLRTISAAMRRFSQGDFLAEPIRATSNDEIGELAHSYNGALHHLHSAFAQRDRTEAEIRQFIADAGHELRTPLTVIMGYLDALEDGAVDTPGVRERVFATLRQESRRMRLLIEKLIYLARLERGEPAARELVDVSAVITRVASSMTPSDAAAIEISTVPRAMVVADAAEIAESVRNLVDNALKYAPSSTISISTDVQGDDVVLVVRDHGPGIPSEEQDHVFDRFYRGHGNRDVEGTGLGLAIVKRAVHRSAGTIELESRIGEGTRFTIRLPHATA
jgi:two-component system, OmpR family, sensor kinase